MGLEDLASIFGTNVLTLLGAVWFLSGKISVVNHRLSDLDNKIGQLEKGLDTARGGRAQIWEKHNELTNRVTAVETKVGQ